MLVYYILYHINGDSKNDVFGGRIQVYVHRQAARDAGEFNVCLALVKAEETGCIW